MMIWKNSSWSVLGYLVPTSDAETSRRPTVQLQTGRSRRLGCFMQLPRAPGRMSGVHGEMSPGQSCKSRWRETFGLSRDIPSLTHPVVCVCWGSLQKVLMLVHGAFNEAQRPASTESVVGEVMGRRARP